MARRRARPADPRRRAIGLLVVFGILFTAVSVRLVDIQVLRSARYVSWGEAQRINSITLPAGRGALFDRNGDHLAISTPTQTVYADPRLISSPGDVAARLAPVLGADRADLAERLSSDAEFVYLSRQVDDEVAQRVRDLDITGVSFLEEPKRFYPAGDLAESLLGHVDPDGVGYSGLELLYDEAMTGEPGELIREVGPDGNTIPAGRQHVEPAQPGDDLVLTIDRALQWDTEQILAHYVEQAQASRGSAVVSDPETGEVLAMANVGRDPETGEATNLGNNVAVTANYEPGSVNKVITIAAAVEEGVVTPDTSLLVPDSLQVADHTFTDDHEHPTEYYDVTDILAESSNVGTIMVAQQLGAERLDEYLRRFGFGEPTALGLPYEENGQLLDPDDWDGTSIGSFPIGQGISVTAMQMLQAYNTIANDGVYQPPTLLSAVVDSEGERQAVAPAESRRVVSPPTARQVRDMLTVAVEDGTGTAAAIEGYEVAGKTGTAWKPQPGGGYLNEDGTHDYISTFAGFLPADDPKLSIIVVIDEPSTSPYAADVAAPAFAEIGRSALGVMGIPPTDARSGPGDDGERVRSAPASTATIAGGGARPDPSRSSGD